MSRGGAERERVTQNPRSRLQAPSCQHRARRGAEHTNREIRPGAEVGRLTESPRRPPKTAFYLSIISLSVVIHLHMQL